MTLQAHDSIQSNEANLSAIAGRASADVKLGHKVAVMLQHEIISAGLGGGCSLGTAAQVRSRYKVGRWALREAVGILELRGIARLRIGRGGGVIVTEPDFGDLVNLTLLYLYANRSRPQEISEARRSVITAVVKKLLDCSAGSLTPQALSAAGHTTDIPRFLGAQTGNGALQLAVEFVESVRDACVPQETLPTHWGEQGTRLWVSICQRDKDAALTCLDALLTADEQRMSATWKGLSELSKPRGGGGKLAYRLALEILKDLVEHPDRSDDFFGSEADIGMQFDANAEIVRQAVRLVEDLGVVALRRGRHGGVVRREANAASIAALIPHLLSQQRISVATCFEAARFLSDEITRLAATRVKEVGKVRSGLLLSPAATTHDLIAMDRQIQTYSNNQMLLCIERGLGFYSCAMEPPTITKHSHDDRLIALSRRVFEAVEDGDVEGASMATHKRFELMAMRFDNSRNPVPA